MERFFFDVEVLGKLKTDAEGRLLLDRAAAVAEAKAYAASLAGADIQYGDGASFGSIVVRSEHGIIHRESLVDAADWQEQTGTG